MGTNMNGTETKDSKSNLWLNSPQLVDDLQEMGQSVKQMLKLIQDGESLSKDDEMHRPKLDAHVKEFYHSYESLAKRYDHLTGELQKSLPSGFQLQVSPLLTPDQKMGLHKSARQAVSPSSGGSSDFSVKEGTELSSSSSSSSDSESESFISSVNNNADSLSKGVVESESYQELLGRVTKYEEKLRASEEEVARLKSELNARIESAQRDITMREADLELERTRIIELETRVSEADFEIERLVKELQVSRERLKGSDEEIDRLKNEHANEMSEVTHQLQGQLKFAQEDAAVLTAKLDSEKREVLKLQETVARYETNLSDREVEVRDLKITLSDALELQSELEARLKEWELQGKLLDDKIRQSETEKMEMKGLIEDQENRMQSQINQLTVEIAERGNYMEALNKNFDKHKLKYDTLMAEKDEVNAKVNTLMAEASSRDNHIAQMEEHVQKLHMEHAEMNAASETARKLIDELRVRVNELEKEVDRQRIVILEGAEEKREAIRQLCFSLEHYRSGYKELREVFVGYKRHAVMAA